MARGQDWKTTQVRLIMAGQIINTQLPKWESETDRNNNNSKTNHSNQTPNYGVFAQTSRLLSCDYETIRLLLKYYAYFFFFCGPACKNDYLIY